MQISKTQARRFMLDYQGLGTFYRYAGKMGILDFVQKVGSIQFDALNIVGRNPELVLQSRIEDFRPAMLYELLYQERRLLDGPDKEMCIYSVEDWPNFRRRREAAVRRFGHENRPIMPFLPQIRQQIENEGPLSSSDLNLNQVVDWPWAPTRLSRAALESMYLWGELVIHHKVNSRKVYDFSNRRLPREILSAPEPNITEAEYYDWCVLRRIGSIGLLWNRSGEAWTGISRIHSQERSEALGRLLKQGKIFEVQVEGIKLPFYLRSSDKVYVDGALQSNESLPRASILAPLDNLLWDRQLIKDVFEFEYRWEVYKPQAERRYGYYVLPILYGDRFVARFEPGMDKKKGVLIIKNWWWEPGIAQTPNIQLSLQQCFQRFLRYLGANTIQIDEEVKSRKGLEWLGKC
jgi:uncharacterized protein